MEAQTPKTGDSSSRRLDMLLDVPPDTRGLIPDEHVQALMRLRKNAGL